MSRIRLGPWLLSLLPVLLSAGCDLPGKPRRPEPPDKRAQFDTLYATHCAGCHGADGKLGPAPPLNDPIFLALISDDDLMHVIADGRTVTAGQRSLMPAFAQQKGGSLTTDEVRALAEGIKPRWGPPAVLPSDLREKGAGGDKYRGARVFARACADCHGDTGEGIERDGRLRRKINDPAFLALISDRALRRYIITGRPDLGMPPYDGKTGRGDDFRPLTAAEIDDLIALLACWRQGESANDKGGSER